MQMVPFLYSAADEAEAFLLDEPGEKRLRQSCNAPTYHVSLCKLTCFVKCNPCCFSDLPKAAAAAVHAVAPKSRNTTYGEVLPQSIWKHVISAMNLQASDVFYDIGSGTGKIPLQVALQAGCVAKGVEFVAARHAIGNAALDRCKNWTQQHADDCIGDATTKRAVAATLARVQLIEGDACDPSIDLHDATAIFINNVLFQPDLMDRIVARLAALPRLRTVRQDCQEPPSVFLVRKLITSIATVFSCLLS